ncbi:hypothetical protein NQ318_005761 [Aromia moschata]|uniref:Nicastrin n=1 Tax=Aromia moschata TaxID=1265417 RepID=A0AAV8YSZ3_9CUCU|nr:hypothetical protein NQ318_005761 [Aromia moschata]
MARLKCFALYFPVLLQLVALGYGERTKDKMYEKITSGTSCYRRLNATHQIGCSSKRGGSTGVVHYCDTLEDLNYILQNGTAPPLIQSGKVSGLILHANNTEKLDYFTHENQCPNPQTSLEGTCNKKSVWNPYGTGLLYEDIPFPVSYLSSDEEVDKIKECFDKFNNYSYDSQAERPLCSLELEIIHVCNYEHSTLHEVSNFKILSTIFKTLNLKFLRRSNMTTNLHPVKFCDPLGDMNIWAALYPLVSGTKRNETKPIRDSKYIVIAARLDTTSMFEMTAGANSPVTGVVTLLSTARLLKSMLKREDIDNAKKNVLFILFNGETYDYIGSQRLFYDMQRSDFPVRGLKPDNEFLPVIRPENISLFIELSQLGNAQNEKIFVHYLKEKTEISNFYNKLSANQDSIVISKVPDSLPPASLHTFMKNDTDFPGLILTDHETSYTNPLLQFHLRQLV